VPEAILECVAFLATQDPGEDASERKCRGTAFFVRVDTKRQASTYHYLVTAKHCVAQSIKENKELYVRLNLHDGGCDYVRIHGGWMTHEDPSVDLAVLPFTPDNSRFRYMGIPSGGMADDPKFTKYHLGIGEEVVIAGLFTRRAGHEENLPIVRFGNISAMPSEPLPDTKTGLDFHAYLVEARSFGGLSGSPVFAYLNPVRPAGSLWEQLTTSETRVYVPLCGVIRGHWEHGEAIPFASAYRDELDKINWGIATVTPINYLRDILFSEEAVKDREAKEKKRRERDAPVSDFAQDDKKKTAEPLTKAEFDSVLRTVSRKITTKQN
jgi:hypothetical protein